MNESAEINKKRGKFFVKTGELGNEHKEFTDKKQASFEASSPGTRSPGSSLPQLDRSEMNIKTLN